MAKLIEEINSSVSLKTAYILIILSLAISVFALIKVCKSGGSENSEISQWVDNNPDKILESVQKYAMAQQDQQQQQQQKSAGENIKKYRDELSNLKDQAMVNKNGKKVVVEFFDYDCPYCRMAAKTTRDLLAKRKDVKLILLPLLIHQSARPATEIGYAIVLTKPEKFVTYYESIMADGQGQSEALIADAVKKAGLNLDDLKKVVASKGNEITKLIANASNYAGQLGVNGTPGFIILNSTGTLIPGAVDGAQLETVIDQ